VPTPRRPRARWASVSRVSRSGPAVGVGTRSTRAAAARATASRASRGADSGASTASATMARGTDGGRAVEPPSDRAALSAPLAAPVRSTGSVFTSRSTPSATSPVRSTNLPGAHSAPSG